jgi:hypothetical protein
MVLSLDTCSSRTGLAELFLPRPLREFGRVAVLVG